MLKVHENIGNQRIKFAASISDSAEDLLSLGRNIEKDRKKIKDAGMHYEKLVSDSDLLLEKVSIYPFFFFFLDIQFFYIFVE